MFDAWIRLGYDTLALGLEAQEVIALRLMKVAAGGSAASRECHLMVTEKVAASHDAGFKVLSSAIAGHSPQAIMSNMVEGYRTRVRSNRRRLSAS
ncbi:MAG: hypothetical protein PW790_13360 [Parvibaculaceae bacterium]|nr:hypothetical protein [Parvibaculaceae bacterium]